MQKDIKDVKLNFVDEKKPIQKEWSIKDDYLELRQCPRKPRKPEDMYYEDNKHRTDYYEKIHLLEEFDWLPDKKKDAYYERHEWEMA